jgi:uracil-DNA glycosylase
MEKLTGKSQTIQLTNNLSLKKQYLSQNKDLFGEEIFLELPRKSKLSKTVTIDDTWYYALQNEFKKDYWHSLTEVVRKLYKTKTVYPEPKNMFNAFDSTPFDRVKVVIIGQDPYHGDGQAHGLSFSVQENTKIPPSLRNIYKELHSDLDLPIPDTGNLQSWADQGVLMLNTVLTVEANNANSHKDLGWEIFTKAAIEAISRELKNVVFILWGKQAQSLSSILNDKNHYILSSAHPSPLSAHNGFFGCKHFSKANDYLSKQGKDPINWSI